MKNIKIRLKLGWGNKKLLSKEQVKMIWTLDVDERIEDT